MKNYVTGVDIGGSHITVCIVDLDTGRLVESTRHRAPVDPMASANTLISSWAAAIRTSQLVLDEPMLPIGIAMPGPFDYEKGVSYIRGLAKFESLYGLDIKQLLAEALQISPDSIRFVNDATAYVKGECSMGCAKGDRQVLGITLGTGLGSALQRNGQTEDGDLYCFSYAGKFAEDYLSTRWFLSEYARLNPAPVAGVRELAAMAPDNAQVMELFQRFGNNLGQVIRARYKGAMPATLVIGGNIALASPLFQPALQEALGSQVEIKLASLGEAAALMGAASLWQ